MVIGFFGLIGVVVILLVFVYLWFVIDKVMLLVLVLMGFGLELVGVIVGIFIGGFMVVGLVI